MKDRRDLQFYTWDFRNHLKHLRKMKRNWNKLLIMWVGLEYYCIAFNVTVWLFSNKLLLLCFWLWIVGSEEWCGTYSSKISKKWGKISATSKVGLLPIRFLIEVLRHSAFYFLQYSGICWFFLQHCSIQNPPPPPNVPLNNSMCLSFCFEQIEDLYLLKTIQLFIV